MTITVRAFKHSRAITKTRTIVRAFRYSRAITKTRNVNTMAANSRAKIELVLGGGSISGSSPFGDNSTLEKALKLLKDEGVNRIDTAHLYGDSEEILGHARAGDRFVIDSKIKGGFEPGSARRNGVIEGIDLSLKRLHIKKLGIFYMHAPDYEVPIHETLEAVNEVFEASKFERFGLSNYKAEDVEAVYDHCKKNGYPLPTVYQGNYSAVARKLETSLFPVLRKLNISFYAYSPMAGGFLAKTKEQVLDGAGRFNESAAGGSMYTKMYKKPSYLEALSEWNGIAQGEGCSKAALAYRWMIYHSQLDANYGDGVLIGASGLHQLEETLSNIKDGPLSKESAAEIDQMWQKLEIDAPTDNFHL